MRLRDENKRRVILETAARLFSQHPFHKVRLDDVALAANIGKGTVYIYFKSKEELYYSLIYDGFAEIVQELGQALANGAAAQAPERIGIIVKALVRFAKLYPQFFEALRTVAPPLEHAQWETKWHELVAMIEQTLRQGNASGAFADGRPDLTALYFPAMVRAIMLHGSKDIDADVLSQHITSIVLHGITRVSR